MKRPYIYGQFWYEVEGNPIFEIKPQPVTP